MRDSTADNIQNHKKLLREQAESLLDERIELHLTGKCNCDTGEGGVGLCYAGQWLEGKIADKQVVEDLGNNPKTDAYLKRTLATWKFILSEEITEYAQETLRRNNKIN